MVFHFALSGASGDRSTYIYILKTILLPIFRWQRRQSRQRRQRLRRRVSTPRSATAHIALMMQYRLAQRLRPLGQLLGQRSTAQLCISARRNILHFLDIRIDALREIHVERVARVTRPATQLQRQIRRTVHRVLFVLEPKLSVQRWSV